MGAAIRRVTYALHRVDNVESNEGVGQRGNHVNIDYEAELSFELYIFYCISITYKYCFECLHEMVCMYKCLQSYTNIIFSVFSWIFYSIYILLLKKRYLINSIPIYPANLTNFEEGGTFGSPKRSIWTPVAQTRYDI